MVAVLTKTTDAKPAAAANPDALLARELGVRQLAANIFNFTVGSGIFVLPAVAVAMLGSAAPLAYLACAVVMGLVVLCFAEAGSRVSATGGTYAYVEAALGPFVGFIAGCLVFTTGLASAAAVCAVFARSLLALMPAVPAALSNVLIVVIITVLVLVNVRGIKTSARVLEGITIAKLLPLLAFVFIGVAFITPSNLTMQELPSMSSVLGTAGFVIFAFAGIEGAMIPSGEVRNPARTVPRAVFLALGGATLLYLTIQFVALGVMGPALAQEETTPLANAAGAMLGPTARTVMIVAAVVSMFGYLSANILSEPRGLFAFSRDRFLPQALAMVHPRFRTPSVSIIVYGVLVAALTLSGTFERLLIFANLTVLLLYFLCAVAALVLRRRDVRSDGAPFLIPGGAVVPVLACAALTWLTYETARTNLGQFKILGVVLAVIVALYGVRELRELWARRPAT
jgi:basic amino acid/polyamine antiporter, APA family